jgi:hypothetical protein
MTVPTAVVSEQDWKPKREVPTYSWAGRHDEYIPEELSGGRTSA